MKTPVSQSQVHSALNLALEKLEACRELANEAHTVGLEDLASSYLIEADTTRQAVALLASWLHAFLYVNGKTTQPPREQHHTAADFDRALILATRTPCLIARQAY